jgi:hypothetical protein
MLAACPLISWEARMSRFVEFTIALLVLGVCVPAATVQAATLCRTPNGEDALGLLAQRHVEAPDLLADCVEKCVPGAQHDLMLLVDDIPAPRHLPLLSSADEVASRHADIFEIVSSLREDPEALEYCQLTL